MVSEKNTERRAKVKAKATAHAKKVRSKAKGHSSGFMNFIREQGVIGLAVGLAIGTAAGATVKVIVQEFVDPIVALLTQGVNLSNMRWVIMSAEKSASHQEISIGYGAILSSLIVLIATALVIYFIIHMAKLDRLDRKK